MDSQNYITDQLDQMKPFLVTDHFSYLQEWSVWLVRFERITSFSSLFSEEHTSSCYRQNPLVTISTQYNDNKIIGSSFPSQVHKINISFVINGSTGESMSRFQTNLRWHFLSFDLDQCRGMLFGSVVLTPPPVIFDHTLIQNQDHGSAHQSNVSCILTYFSVASLDGI